MKKILILSMMCVGSIIYAQHHKKGSDHHKQISEKTNSFTPEQKAELRTKQITLHLDLSESQQIEMNKLQLDIIKMKVEREKNRKSLKDLTSEQLFELKRTRLDEKIAIKNRLKAILTPEQFDRWQARNHRKRRGLGKFRANKNR